MAIGGGVSFLAVVTIALVLLLPRTTAAPAGSLQATPAGNSSKGSFRRSRLFLHRGSVIEFGAIWENYEPVAERERFWNSIQFTD